jgi:hypothetical protein
MDHIEALREKIARLRLEIADIHELNDRDRFRARHAPEVETARVQRQQRLAQIQEELIQLSKLNRKAVSTEQMRENLSLRLRTEKRAS